MYQKVRQFYKLSIFWYIYVYLHTNICINSLIKKTSILKKITNFTQLKYLFIIPIYLFGLTFTSFAQNKIASINGDPSAKLIKYYPNPATTAINFEFIQGYDKSFSLQLYNFMGKKVLDVNKLYQLNNLSLNGFYRGVYIFRLSDKNGNVVESGKFQIVQ